MLEYVKLILEKVSFDKDLFEKELRKGVKELLPNELKELKKWCYSKFDEAFFKIFNNVFGRVSIS